MLPVFTGNITAFVLCYFEMLTVRPYLDASSDYRQLCAESWLSQDTLYPQLHPVRVAVAMHHNG